MSETVVVGLLAFLGTVIGSVVSIVTSNALTNYKIDELKKQVEKHNSLIERTFRLEERESVLETKVEQLEKGVER